MKYIHRRRLSLSRISLFSCVLFIVGLFFISSGCDDAVQQTSNPTLSISTTAIVFPAPMLGQVTSEVSVEVSNTGGAQLQISEAELIEDDPVTELILLDRADWAQGNVTLEPGVTRTLRLQWTILDAQPDRGRLTLISNGGTVTLSIDTPDLDPELSLTATPGGPLDSPNGAVEITSVRPGEVSPIRVMLKSEGSVPLTLEGLCLVGVGEDCLDGQESADGVFRLCHGIDPSEDCAPPMIPDEPLLYGAEYTFSLLYAPTEGSFDQRATRVLIASDSTSAPRYILRFTGVPCRREAAEDICGTCGDGVLDEREGCDDGNLSEADGCLNDCTLTTCGDAQVQGEEECDDGDGSDEDDCLSTCKRAICGDGVTRTDLSEGDDGFEACDDGDDDEDDACLPTCALATCGDGVVRTDLMEGEVGFEACDDGNESDEDDCLNSCAQARCGDGVIHQGQEECDGGEAGEEGCTETCQRARCGDGVRQSGEQCDDGNPDGGDGCDELCRTESCGNGVVQGDEACDDGGESATCNVNCTLARCGDLIVNMQATEQCDTGGESPTCDIDCTTPVCGDRVLNRQANEQCDIGGESTSCDFDCTFPQCGDGLVNRTAGEQCDTGGASASCDADCTSPVCGDGVINTFAGEECDDRGPSASCNIDCTLAVCGDGLVNQLSNEQCDDRGESAGCNANCTLARCGDGVINASRNEQCDDRVQTANCNANCTLAVCGDGLVNPLRNEQCDDRVQTANCNSNCTLARCGDGVINQARGEECDDRGETPNCNADCTLAECGDGYINQARGEQCDDRVESQNCDVDCTSAFCGDGVINQTRGEVCDGGPLCSPSCQPEAPLSSYLDRCLDPEDCETGLCVEDVGDTQMCTIECVTHEDCASEHLCILGECIFDDTGEECSSNTPETCASNSCLALVSSSTGHCTRSCSTADECPAGYACADIEGQRVCVDIELSCTSPADCLTGLCIPSLGCTSECQAASDCPRRYPTLDPYPCAIDFGASQPICVPPIDIIGDEGLGTICQATQIQCRSGLCDTDIFPDNEFLGICTQICTTEGGCPAGFGCAPVIEDTGIVLVCKPAGSRPIGAPCDRAADCASALCDATNRICSRFCTDDQLCPSDMLCLRIDGTRISLCR